MFLCRVSLLALEGLEMLQSLRRLMDDRNAIKVPGSSLTWYLSGCKDVYRIDKLHMKLLLQWHQRKFWISMLLKPLRNYYTKASGVRFWNFPNILILGVAAHPFVSIPIDSVTCLLLDNKVLNCQFAFSLIEKLGSTIPWSDESAVCVDSWLKLWW